MTESKDYFWNSVGTKIAVIAALLAAGSFLFRASFSDIQPFFLKTILFFGGVFCALSAPAIVLFSFDDIFETDFYKKMEEINNDIEFPSKGLAYFLFSCVIVLGLFSYINDRSGREHELSLILTPLILLTAALVLVFSKVIFKLAFTRPVTLSVIAYAVAFGALATALVPLFEKEKEAALERESLIYSWCQIVMEGGMERDRSLKEICLETAGIRLNDLSK